MITSVYNHHLNVGTLPCTSQQPSCTHDLVKAMYCNIKDLISKHSAFPSVIVWVQQQGAWKHASI